MSSSRLLDACILLVVDQQAVDALAVESGGVVGEEHGVVAVELNFMVGGHVTQVFASLNAVLTFNEALRRSRAPRPEIITPADYLYHQMRTLLGGE